MTAKTMNQIQGLRPLARAVALGSLLLLGCSTMADATTLQSHSYTYDALGRVKTDTDAYNHTATYTYDVNGNRLTSTDALNRVTTYTYDELDRLSTVTDPSNKVTSYSYDALGHLVTVTDPLGNATSYTYDGLNQLLSQSSPDTGGSSYTYNSAGQVSSRTNAANQQTQATYDAKGRPSTVTYADGRVVTYTYDQGTNGLGRLTSVSDADSSLSWTYDAQGRVLSQTQTIGAGGNAPAYSYMQSYQYNSAGQLTQVTYPSGSVLTYTYDGLGRVQSLSQNGVVLLNSIQYRAFGGITGWTWGNGSSHTRTYDQNGALNYQTLGNTGITYGYDAVGNLTGTQDLASNTQTYGYDALDRVNSYAGNGSTHGYSYDANGNRLTHSNGSSTETYSYPSTSNKLSSITTTPGSTTKSYSYTANGATSGDGNNTYTYDARERLTAVSNSTGSASYKINPLGQRVMKATASGNTFYVYDPAGHLVAETNNTGAVTQEYVYLGGMPVALSRNTATLVAPIWSTSFGTAPTASTNPTGIISPYNSLFKWESATATGNTSGVSREAIHTANGGTQDDLNSQQQYAKTQSVVTQLVYNTGATVGGTGRNAMFGVRTTGAWNSGATQVGVKFNGNTLSFSCKALVTCSSTLSSSVQDNTTYIVQITTGPTVNNVVVYQQGKDPSTGWAASIPTSNISWDADSTGRQRFLLIEAYSNTVDNPSYLYSVTDSAAPTDSVANPAIVPLSNTAPGWIINGTPLPTKPTGSSSDPSGIYISSDPYSQFVWDTTQAHCANACLGVVTKPNGAGGDSYPAILGTGRYTTQATRLHLEFSQPTTVSGGHSWMLTGMQNNGSAAGGTLRYQLLKVVNGKAYVQYMDGNTHGSDGTSVVFVTQDLNYTIQDNQSYTLEVDSTPTSSTLYVFPQGGTRAQGVSQTLTLDWTGGAALPRLMVVNGYSWAGSTGVSNTLYLTNVAMSQLTGRAVYNVHSDQIDTPRQITTSDSSNTLVWRWDSDPFGASTPNGDPGATGTSFTYNLRFPGQYYDAETGLNYNYFRDYNPATGRYVESDPIGLGGEQLSTYAYVGGNPVSLIDPLGLKPWDWNGKGNTSVCRYYDSRSCQTTGDLHKYYQTAGQICRGNRQDVNTVLSTGIANAWIRGNTSASEADIYNQIRQGLIAGDQAAAAKYGPNGVTGNMIDAYHDQVFNSVGVGSSFYGGNLWPQGVYPNPVPFDPTGKSPYDPRRLLP